MEFPSAVVSYFKIIKVIKINEKLLNVRQETAPDEVDLPVLPVSPTSNAPRQSSSLSSLDALELKAHCISICVIDDCLDADVPLLEVALSQLSLHQVNRINFS